MADRAGKSTGWPGRNSLHGPLFLGNLSRFHILYVRWKKFW